MTKTERLQAPLPTSAELLLLAIWFGLFTGLAEIGLLAVKKFFFHKFLFLSLDATWMAPLFDVVVFVFVAFALILCARYWPWLASLRAAISIFAFLSLLSLMFMYPRLQLYAVLLLAVGLAVQSARVIAAHFRGFRLFVRRTIGWMVAMVLGLAVAVQGWQQVTEQRALAKLPPASPEALNVLLIVLDTVRAQSLSVYGYHRPTTPELERLSKTGVLFERAMSTAPWTLPSHGSIFTGHFPYELSVDWVTPLGATVPTIAEVLSEQGYLTAGFAANTLYCSWESGLSRGFSHYEDFLISPGEIARSSSLGRTITNAGWLRQVTGNQDILGRKTAARVNQDFLHWLSRNDHRPFFAFLNYYDAHTPYLPPEPFASRFARAKRPLKPWHGTARTWLPQEIRGELDAYEGAIAYIDHHIGVLMEQLGRRGLLEDTLIIITSDHGEAFGEHGFMGHGNSLYLPELHVPLLIRFPSRVPEERRIVEPASLRDLPATIVDLLQRGDKARFPGVSLARYWEESINSTGAAREPLLSEATAEPSVPVRYPVSRGNMKSLLVYPYHYIRNGDGVEEIYDIETDPDQKFDLASSDEGRRMLSQYRKALENALQTAEGHDLKRIKQPRALQSSTQQLIRRAYQDAP